MLVVPFSQVKAKQQYLLLLCNSKGKEVYLIASNCRSILKKS